ncbi:TPA: LemA family protein [Candidatus Galligastranaerophilus intestinigallinarum]|nr:LemA family protein [Candidatus Galligastranaerophilus intestinigallinarum]
MVVSIVLVIVGLLILVGFVSTYNGLVSLKNAVKNSWAQIDTQLKRRYDLIPNLIECVKGYMEHEKTVFENVVNARNLAMKPTDSLKEKAEAENQLTSTLKSLFALSENYPDLKASQNFLALQEELASTENKIAYARVAYNDSVMFYQNKKEQFPSNIVAMMFNFKDMEFFEAADNEKEAVKVKF